MPGGAPPLVACAAWVIGCLVLYGALQERLMAHPFPIAGGGGGGDGLGEFFRWPLLLVLLNRLVAAAAAAGSLVAGGRGEELRLIAPLWAYAAISASNVVASRCQYAALRHLSFPAQALGKSAKVGPALLWGRIVAQRTYSPRELASAAATFGGCALFFLAGGGSGTHAVAARLPGASSSLGLLLLASYLAADGFTGAFQERLFVRGAWGGGMSAQNHVFWVSICSAAGAAGTLALSGELVPALSFLAGRPGAAAAAAGLAVAAATGQFGITTTVRAHGGLALASVLGARQPASVALSCALFGHALVPAQALGAAVAFAALLFPRGLRRGSEAPLRPRSESAAAPPPRKGKKKKSQRKKGKKKKRPRRAKPR